MKAAQKRSTANYRCRKDASVMIKYVNSKDGLDRDEIARSLGLSGGQGATWFRNRRPKYRRNLKDFKSEAAKIMDNEKINRLCKRWKI